MLKVMISEGEVAPMAMRRERLHTSTESPETFSADCADSTAELSSRRFCKIFSVFSYTSS